MTNSKLVPPIFVIGAPRSGTTWLLELLLHHPYTFHINSPSLELDHLESPWPDAFSKETNLFNRMDEAAVKETVDLLIKSKSGVGIEKTPENVFHLEKISKLWPRSSPIIIYRNPYDVITSLMRISKTWASSWAPSTIENGIAFWRHFVAPAIEYDGRSYEITYEDLLEDTEGLFTELLEYYNLTNNVKVIKNIIKKTSEGKTIANMSGVYWKGRAGNYLDYLKQSEIKYIRDSTKDYRVKIADKVKISSNLSWYQ